MILKKIQKKNLYENKVIINIKVFLIVLKNKKKKIIDLWFADWEKNKFLENNFNIKNHLKNLYLNLKVQESFQLLRTIINEKSFWTKEKRNDFFKDK